MRLIRSSDPKNLRTVNLSQVRWIRLNQYSARPKTVASISFAYGRYCEYDDDETTFWYYATEEEAVREYEHIQSCFVTQL